MKKLILSAILFLGITTMGFSQEVKPREQRSPEERAQKITDALDKKLSLTEAQKEEIYKINLERAHAINKAKASGKRADMGEIKTTFEASENKILSVLDDKQKATYNQLKAERKAKAKKHHGGHNKAAKEEKG